MHTVPFDTSRAVCATTDPDLWYADTPAEQQEAADICRATCPLLRACAEYALTTRQQHGVWGGMTRSDRRPARQTLAHQTSLAA
ncbi:WhiB family transcriptional regulator [Streptomyces uncialis]|uniref:Transcriptional regulator WhiB n=1 Tax=Streptomyces uncialis TaxID=1048205 RepID=A0A1Q4V145_9ACTN|nr:WhiB family transcriptional regulator [Streptomyces uncialis]OKH91469.1 hypothetical protein AB852_28325 [Streptomyces uncialis]